MRGDGVLLFPWLKRLLRQYRDDMPDKPSPRRVRPVPRASELARYEGLWVAVLNGEVVAAEHTSHKLATRLHDMDHRKRRELTVEYVRPQSDSYIVGVG